MNRIVHLLRSNNSIIICTGRGLGCVEKIVIEPILSKLLPNERQIIKNIAIATHNGSTIYEISANQNYENLIFNKLVEFKLENSQEIFEAIKNKFGDLLVLEGNGHKSKFKPTSVVLTFKDCNTTPTTQEVNKYLYELGFRNFKVLMPGKGKMDVVSNNSGKKEAIDFISNKRNLSTENIARFGDQGGPGGNDEKMLNHPLGRVVDNPEQTQNILSNLQIEGGIKLEPDYFQEQKNNSPKIIPYHKSAKIVRQNFAVASQKNLLEIQNQNFYTVSYFENLKFSFTGAIRFKKDEITNLTKSPLKEFANIKSIIDLLR